MTDIIRFMKGLMMKENERITLKGLLNGDQRIRLGDVLIISDTEDSTDDDLIIVSWKLSDYEITRQVNRRRIGKYDPELVIITGHRLNTKIGPKHIFLNDFADNVIKYSEHIDIPPTTDEFFEFHMTNNYYTVNGYESGVFNISPYISGTFYAKSDLDTLFKWEAKRYDKPSKYGINNGRISKLTISETYGDKVVICQYDRGWVIKPVSDQCRYMLEQILERYN